MVGTGEITPESAQNARSHGNPSHDTPVFAHRAIVAPLARLMLVALANAYVITTVATVYASICPSPVFRYLQKMHECAMHGNSETACATNTDCKWVASEDVPAEDVPKVDGTGRRGQCTDQFSSDQACSAADPALPFMADKFVDLGCRGEECEPGECCRPCARDTDCNGHGDCVAKPERAAPCICDSGWDVTLDPHCEKKDPCMEGGKKRYVHTYMQNSCFAQSRTGRDGINAARMARPRRRGPPNNDCAHTHADATLQPALTGTPRCPSPSLARSLPCPPSLLLSPAPRGTMRRGADATKTTATAHATALMRDMGAIAREATSRRTATARKTCASTPSW